MTKHIDRRKFLKQAGVTSGALIIGFNYLGCQPEVPEPEGVIELFKLNVDDMARGFEINPFITIDPENGICIYNHKPDMGQGTFQSMPLIIAEELDVDLAKVTIKQAPGSQSFGNQGVGGSATVRTMYMPMRKMGAAARTMLVAAAAAQWNTSPENCRTESGKVINTLDGSTLEYTSLAEAAAQLEVPEEPSLKNPANFKLIGKSLPKPSVPLKVRGQANFGIDMKKEGMVYASIERSPSFSAKVKTINDTEALALPGVLQVIKCIRPVGMHNYEGVAVIAENYWAATQGRAALKIEWEAAEKLPGTEEVYQTMRKLADEEEGLLFHEEGKFASSFQKASKQVDAAYETPFLAHSAMEPQNVLAEVTEEGVEIWAPTQFPQWLMATIAEELEIEQEKVKVHVSFLGGGFGRRALPDFGLEAVLLSKEVKKPVKVIWSREDDTQQSPFRPGAVNRLSAGLDENGNILALKHKVVAPSIRYSLFSKWEGKDVPGAVMEPIGEMLYKIPNFESRYVYASVHPIPLCWWRSVYSSTNVFAHECFIDELAEAAGTDPFDFREQYLGHNDRYKSVLSLLREKSNWDTPHKAGVSRGVAFTHCFSTVAAHVVEVSRDKNGVIQIDKVTTAIHCGIAINPDNIKAQTEGCIVMGLTAALKDPITFKDGVAQESNFHNYRMLRINEMPKEIDIHIVPSLEDPTGVGEPGLPPIAPALVNAIYGLSKERIRKLPFKLDEC